MTDTDHKGRLWQALVLAALGLAGLVWMIWPRPPARELLDPSERGSQWLVERDRAVLRGETMGSTYTVVIAGDPPATERLLELQGAIEAVLAEIDLSMSTYRPDSELSRFNDAPANVPFAASQGLRAVVAEAQAISERSGGAFDVTVAPIVEAWGFGPAKQAGPRQPSERELADLRARVGWQRLVLDPEAGTLVKRVEGLRVDLSAIAPGYAGDRISTILSEAGLDRHMVEVGGEVRAKGSNPAGEGWKIGIERPTNDALGERTVQAILRVHDAGVATSGDYRNYWEKDGRRYSHTIDPRTGRPITHALASVTVVHETAALADGWATALNVLGPDAGLELAEAEGIAASFLVRTIAGGFEVRSTAAYLALDSREGAPR